jgi:release factor glutamine methyltransferase
MILTEHLRQARARLAGAGIPEPEAALDAELLARDALRCDRAGLLARLRDKMPAPAVSEFANAVERRVRREPIAYIRGRQEFWGREFLVSSGVLIPRPETELIIEESLAWRAARPRRAPRVLDVGTGSGCLAITLALEWPDAEVTATDISDAALAVARANATHLGARVTFHEASGTGAFSGPIDLLVSNPPYIPMDQYAGLQAEVRDHEPVPALVGGDDGLLVVREVVAGAARQLAPGGLLLMEFGFGQAGAVREIVENADGLRLLRIRDDLQAIPRVVVAASAA